MVGDRISANLTNDLVIDGKTVAKAGALMQGSVSQVVSGSKTDPVKFEEYWTFTRPVGNNPWRLSGIDQK